MDGQRARHVTSIDRVPVIEATGGRAGTAPTGQRARTTRWAAPPGSRLPAGRLTTGWAAVIGLGWPLVVAASMALEPAPAQPAAPDPLIVELGSLALLAALLTAVVAAGLRHAVAPVAGAAAGVVFLAFAVLCPVTGHHTAGLWWVGELGLVAGMLGLSLAALGSRARMAG